MDYKVGHGSIQVFKSIPDEYKSFARHKAPGELIVTDFLKLFAHLFPGTGYIAALVDYRVHDNGTIGAEEDKPILEFRCGMERRLTGKWEGFVNSGLPPWHFNLSSAKYIKTMADFQKNHHCRVFDIHLKREFFEFFRVAHPIFGEFIDKVDAGQPVELSPHPMPCSLPMRQAIWNIINSPFSDEFSLKARDHYVRIILLVALRLVLSPGVPYTLNLVAHQRDALHHIKKLIENNLDQPYTNEDLCRKVMISEEVLLVGFRQLFGTTPYDYYVDLKFIEAEKKLMDTSEKILAIAHGVGYSESQGFDKEFKKRHNCTPREFRDHYRG